MNSYTTGHERALAGSRIDIAGQSMHAVQSQIHVLRAFVQPLHRTASVLSEEQHMQKRAAQAKQRELHAKNHELARILASGAPSPELEIATQGIWNWGITHTEGSSS